MVARSCGALAMHADVRSCRWCARVAVQMFSMLPGFNSELMPQANDKAGQMMMKRYITIIESMTDKELDTNNIKILQVGVAWAR